MAIYVKGDAVENATSYELLEKTADGKYTSLAVAGEINFDVSALGLPNGEHTLVVMAKADGYEDSEYSNEVVYTVTEGYVTMPLSSFMDLVGTTSGSININTNTGAPTLNTSTNWRYAKISLADYDIKHLTLVTGSSGNGVAPVIFTSSEQVVKETVVDKRYGATHQYITNEHMRLLDGDITIPDGATHMVMSELLDYGAASTTNADKLMAMCQVTYRVKA